MTKTELINELATNLERSKKDVTEVVDAVFNTIINEVSEGNEIAIHGFGKFVRVVKPQSTARNPKTGEAVDVPEHGVVKFKPSSRFKVEVK